MNVWFAFASRFVHFVRFCSWKGQEDLHAVSKCQATLSDVGEFLAFCFLI
jgi:hypothetical protein